MKRSVNPLIKSTLYIEGDNIDIRRLNGIMGVRATTASSSLWSYETALMVTYDLDEVFELLTKEFQDKGVLIGKLFRSMGYKARLLVEFHSVLYERPNIDVSQKFIRLFYDMNIDEIFYKPIIFMPLNNCKKCEMAFDNRNKYKELSFELNREAKSEVKVRINIAKETLDFCELEETIGLHSNAIKRKKDEWPEHVKEMGNAADFWSYAVSINNITDITEALESFTDTFKDKEAVINSLCKNGADIWIVVVICSQLCSLPIIRIPKDFIAFMYNIGTREIGFDPYIDMPFAKCDECDLLK